MLVPTYLLLFGQTNIVSILIYWHEKKSMPSIAITLLVKWRMDKNSFKYDFGKLNGQQKHAQ